MTLQELTACIPSHCYFFSAFRQGCRTGPQVADLLAIPHTKEDGMKRGKITTELYLSETASKQAAIQEFCERTLCRNYSFRSPFSSQMPEIAAILLANSINYTPIFIFNPKNHKLSGFTS